VKIQSLKRLLEQVKENPQENKNNIKKAISLMNFFSGVHRTEESTKNLSTLDLSLNKTYCPITGLKLFDISDSGRILLLEPHGECRDCKKFYSYDNIAMPDGVSYPRWPLRMAGVLCKGCEAEDLLG
jgi:hypothetical protein